MTPNTVLIPHRAGEIEKQKADRMSEKSDAKFTKFTAITNRELCTARGRPEITMSKLGRVHKTTGHHTEIEWRWKFSRHGAWCHYCEKPLTLKTATKDHQIPLCRAGSDEIYNIVPACLRCNQQKGWRTDAEFMDALPGLSTRAEKSRAAIPYGKTRIALEVGCNEPGLLKKVVGERERVSWAWRNRA